MILEGFKQLEIGDRDAITSILKQDPPEISELTFTNLFIWRDYYHPQWRIKDGVLQVILEPTGEEPFGLPPVGPKDKVGSFHEFLQLLSDNFETGMIGRVPESLAEKVAEQEHFRSVHTPDQSDYVYLTDDLIELSGSKYHQKKNHLNQFEKNYEHECLELNPKLIESVLDMQEAWCDLKDCDQDIGLRNEDKAVYEALKHFDKLAYKGLAITINGKVEAFCLGEPLNPETMVIHVEKANPDIRGLYAAINQRFCREIAHGMTFVNREQDLGIKGLRKAKESYRPDHMVEKFIFQHADERVSRSLPKG